MVVEGVGMVMFAVASADCWKPSNAKSIDFNTVKPTPSGELSGAKPSSSTCAVPVRALTAATRRLVFGTTSASILPTAETGEKNSPPPELLRSGPVMIPLNPAVRGSVMPMIVPANASPLSKNRKLPLVGPVEGTDTKKMPSVFAESSASDPVKAGFEKKVRVEEGIITPA